MEETEVIPQQAVIPFPMEEREGRKSRLIPQSEALAVAVGLPIQEAEAGAIPVEPVVPTANPTPQEAGRLITPVPTRRTPLEPMPSTGAVVITALTPLPFELNSTTALSITENQPTGTVVGEIIATASDGNFTFDLSAHTSQSTSADTPGAIGVSFLVNGSWTANETFSVQLASVR